MKSKILAIVPQKNLSRFRALIFTCKRIREKLHHCSRVRYNFNLPISIHTHKKITFFFNKIYCKLHKRKRIKLLISLREIYNHIRYQQAINLMPRHLRYLVRSLREQSRVNREASTPLARFYSVSFPAAMHLSPMHLSQGA